MISSLVNILCEVVYFIFVQSLMIEAKIFLRQWLTETGRMNYNSKEYTIAKSYFRDAFRYHLAKNNKEAVIILFGITDVRHGFIFDLIIMSWQYGSIEIITEIIRSECRLRTPRISFSALVKAAKQNPNINVLSFTLELSTVGERFELSQTGLEFYLPREFNTGLQRIIEKYQNSSSNNLIL